MGLGVRLPFTLSYPDPWEDPKSRTPNSGLQNSYGVDYRTLRGIYFLDAPRGLGRQGKME